ncbi:MAG: COG1470 family protein [Ilumatobacteraceae bacterium]
MAAQAWFSRSDIEVVPGTSAVFQLTIVNLGDTTESFSLAPVGLAAGWTTIRPGSVTLFGGSQEVVDVEVHPPLLPSTTAGPTALTVRIVPQSDPDDVGSSETTLQVGPTFTRRLHMLQPALRARRTAVYEMMLENQGNTQASCRLHLLDPTGRVDGDFDPPAVGVEPGASSLVRLKLHANRLQWQRRSRTVQFSIDADQPGCPTASAPVTFVQASMIPERLFGRLLAALATAAVIGLVWAALVKPAIRSAADDAVAKQLPAAMSSTSVVTVAPVVVAPNNSVPVTTVADAQAPAVNQGKLFSTMLAPAAPAAQTKSVTVDVPAGTTFELTDFFVQNPDRDTGVAKLLNGTNVIYRLSLSDVLGVQRQSLVSPIEVLGGTSLVFEVDCSGANDASGNCTTSMLVSGRMVPATPAG